MKYIRIKNYKSTYWSVESLSWSYIQFYMSHFVSSDPCRKNRNRAPLNLSWGDDVPESPSLQYKKVESVRPQMGPEP